MAPPNPIPNTDFRMIQQEETAAKWSFSESVVQGMGGDNNYLKAEADRIQGLIDNYLTNGGLLITALSFSGGVPAIAVTPNAKNWIACYVTIISASIRVLPPNIVIPGPTTYFGNASGNFPYASISGNSLSVNGWFAGAGNYFGYGIYEV